MIALLIKIFRKYTFLNKTLRFANWTILTIFGISVFDAFGLGFIAKFFNEIRNILGNIIGYLSNTTFYSYIFSMFKSTELIKSENPKLPSIRETYIKRTPGPDYSW